MSESGFARAREASMQPEEPPKPEFEDNWKGVRLEYPNGSLVKHYGEAGLLGFPNYFLVHYRTEDGPPYLQYIGRDNEGKLALKNVGITPRSLKEFVRYGLERVSERLQIEGINDDPDYREYITKSNRTTAGVSENETTVGDDLSR